MSEVAENLHPYPAIWRGKAEPDENRISLLIDRSHFSDLLVSFEDIVLVDADIVDPESSGSVWVTQVMERSLE